MAKQLFEVELKSKALIREGKKGLVTYFEGGPESVISSNMKKLYPKYTQKKDKPVLDITPISDEEYKRRSNGGQIIQKKQGHSGKSHILRANDYEDLGD